MTFLDAAIEVLRQAGRPMSLKDLVARAIQQKLLSHEGRAPEATMQTRLTQELKKGDDSPLVRLPSGQFGLHHYDRPAEETKPEPEPEEAAEGGEARAAAPTAPADETGAKKKRRRRGGRGRKKGGAAAAAAPAATDSPEPTPSPAELIEDSEETAEEGTPEEAILAARLAEEAEAESYDMSSAVTVELPIKHFESPPPGEAPYVKEVDGLVTPPQRRFPHIVNLPSEDSLAQEYADEVGAVAPPVEGEMVDERTPDEDRPMLGEIQGRDRDRERRERRRGRGRDRDRDRDKERPKHAAHGQHGQAAAPAHAPQPQPQSQPQPQPQSQSQPQSTPATAAPQTAQGASTPLAEIAIQLLRSLAASDPRPVHARQLAAMALKRKLVNGDAEDLWRNVRGALIADARLRQAHGLRPRVRQHGGSLFALVRLEDDVRAREEAVAQRVDELAAATFVALHKRLIRLPHAALEQVVRLYLERSGWWDIERVKRSDETWYLGATTRRGALTAKVLVGVRAGGNEIGRKAVGELRAGVMAKHLDEGVLYAPARLGAEGHRELEAHGQLVTIYDGEAFARELVAAGVGVTKSTVPIAYLDADFFADLTEA